LADRIVNPRPPKKAQPSVPASTPDTSEEESELSRAGAIFAAADEAKSFDPNDLGFAFEDGEGLEISPELVESNPAVPVPSKGDTKKRILGMTLPQLGLLGGMLLVEICVLIGFAFFIFQSP
jgi:hypothetical protein